MTREQRTTDTAVCPAKPKNPIIGYIHSTESFGAVDGPGVRFIVFMQGCRMRCRYCHNPETWALTGGTPRTAEDVLAQALKYKSYWKNGGGITVSGGEALLQIDFVIELFRLAKEKGINTALDTSGNPFTRSEPFFHKFQRLCAVTDLFILDIKEINDIKHRDLTGQTNVNILDMARYLSDTGKDMWIRHVLVPGITTNTDDLKGLAEFLKTLKTVKRTEILPYHKLGVPEWERLGIPYTLKDTEPPTTEESETAESILGIHKNK
ncbi:pyruvate formate-lyase-activating protein [Colibacter massiliensis]|uniref:pyruvate formate-lyase-activating protein n=1 Tax=Colibacter massiliensis TaxID=1852379 RepID=UPI003C6ED90D